MAIILFDKYNKVLWLEKIKKDSIHDSHSSNLYFTYEIFFTCYTMEKILISLALLAISSSVNKSGGG